MGAEAAFPAAGPEPAALVIRPVDPRDEGQMRALARLHLELLDFGPMSGLGERFVREVSYAANMRDGALAAALCYGGDEPVGFAAWTLDSAAFHARALRRHALRAGWIILATLLREPRRLGKLARAVRLVLSRRQEPPPAPVPVAEVLAIGVRPEHLTAKAVARWGSHAAVDLVRHAMARAREGGRRQVRMFVDADNRKVQFLYHRLGATFRKVTQAGESVVEVTFDLGEPEA
jgi:ribosomal protein S18 acetylase RimI-like enzyme